MNFLLRIVIAVIIGVLVAGLLNYFKVLEPSLNALIGFLAALLFYFGYDQK